MKTLITTLTKRAKGGIGRRDETITAEPLRIGRGSDNEIFLPDTRVPLHLATLRLGEDGLFIEATGTYDLRVNGAITRAAHLEIGDRLGLGPYEIVILESSDQVELTLTLELVQPLGDDVENLLRRSSLTISDSFFRRRSLSWVLVCVVLAIFLLAPLAWNTISKQSETNTAESILSKNVSEKMAHAGKAFDITWKTGEMLAAHKFFADDCNACHTKPFVMVEDAACTACHTKQHGHADLIKYPMPELKNTRCATCHADHQGPIPIRAQKQSICSDCHSNLLAKLDIAPVHNVSDFGNDHPQFRPTIWIDPVKNIRKRISLDDKPEEISNLKFPHKTHLDRNKMRNPKTGIKEQLNCSSCHITSQSGIYMLPIKMEEHCGDCHILNFDRSAPERLVSHGTSKLVYRELQEYYASQALSGSVQDSEAPEVVRRRPGTPLKTAERLEALKWARGKADTAAAYMFSASQCGSCHIIDNRDSSVDNVSVLPVKVANIWQPK